MSGSTSRFQPGTTSITEVVVSDNQSEVNHRKEFITTHKGRKGIFESREEQKSIAVTRAGHRRPS